MTLPFNGLYSHKLVNSYVDTTYLAPLTKALRFPAMLQ